MEHQVHHPAPHVAHHASDSPSRLELQSAFYGAGLAAIIVAAIYLVLMAVAGFLLPTITGTNSTSVAAMVLTI